MRILLVEDDLMLVDLLTKNLVAQNYSVDTVSDGTTAWDYIANIEYDLVLLDVLLPQLDGVSLCRRIRAAQYETPILILTAQHDSRARVRGLDAGADDYVVKPFDIEELMARIRALIRRSGRDLSPILQFGQLVFDPVHCSASYGGIPLSLSAKEYALLDLFFHEPHHVFSISELLDSLWSSEEYPAEATVRSHIRRLRNKLIDAGAPQDFISNVHGRGYFLKATQETEKSIQQISMIDEQQLKPPSTSNATLQAQYQCFLAETWHQFQPKALSDLQQLENLLESLGDSPRSWSDIEAAKMIAHRFKGSLGLFDQTMAMESAEYIETHMESLSKQSHLAVGAMATLKQHLKVIETALSMEYASPAVSSQLSTESQPFLLCISNETLWTQAMIAAAASLPIKFVVVPSLSSAKAWLSCPLAARQQPDGILVTINQQSSAQVLLEQLDALIPAQSIEAPVLLAVGKTIDFKTRLQAVRTGASYLLDRDQPVLRLLQTSLKLIQPDISHTRALIVDDDDMWLTLITRQLEPLGFQVTALSEPQHFWPTLEMTQPDVLILDIKMPNVSGLELCQTIRSDAHWQGLPIIFVSALTDHKAQASAFSVGADDYLCKPIQGAALAHRIVTRLKRTHLLMAL